MTDNTIANSGRSLLLSSSHMGKKHSDKTTQNDEPGAKRGPEISLSTHLAETAWRVAVPFLVFSLGGIQLDKALETEPIFSRIGVFVALAAVAAVVKRYVERNFPESFKGKKDDK